MNQRHRLAVEDWIEFEDERHQVVATDGALVRLRSITGHRITIMLSELLTDPSFRAFAEPPPEADGKDMGLDPGGVLATVAPAARQAALDLEAHLWEATTGYRSGDPMKAQAGEPRPQYHPDLNKTERILAKAAELGVSDRWLWKLLDRWDEQGLFALVDGRKARVRNPLRNVDPRVIQAIREQSASERLDSSSAVTTRFLRRTQNRLDADYGTGEVPLPKEDTFRRIVRLLLAHRPSDPAYQRQSAANQPDHTFGNVIAHRPGQVVMLDSTPLDVLAWDATTNSTEGLELTVALDLATRSILAWRLTPVGTKAIDIGLLLADVMTPEPMRPAWDDALRYSMLRVPYERMLTLDERLAQAAARPVIYPETLLFDHGKPYQSDVVRRACRSWKIDIQDARKLKPTDKPHIERLFGTIREQFSMHVAGYKGFNVATRGRTVEEQARWSIDEIAEFFAEYVVAVYQQKSHSGLHLHGFPDLEVSPNEAYAMALGSAGFVDCPRDPNLYYELLPIAGKGRVIHPYGVELNYLVYNADVLYQFRNAKSPYPNELWPVRYDPRNLLHAYFHNPRDQKWYTLRWTHALSDVQPFTDITLREAKRLLAQRGQDPSKPELIAQALRDLQNRTDAPETWTKGTRKRWSRDRHRAHAQAVDVLRSTPAVPAPPPPPPAPAPPTRKPTIPGLHAVPNLPDEDDDLDLDAIQPAAVWNPHSAQEN
ncbi:transposase [Kitasatospora sp. NPDC094011]|uniref:transposase n=1 Tax=Kitasatospora sp. NPDC094011 TaxID=3364090 RepID=UPI0037FD5B8B